MSDKFSNIGVFKIASMFENFLITSLLNASSL